MFTRRASFFAWALAVVGVVGSLSAIEVKLQNTGLTTLKIWDWGYWIEYTIDGVTYRSDTAGQRINQIAWEHMSVEDQRKVINAYGAGGGNARIEQFGFDGAQKLVDQHNEDTGWAEAQRKYTEALVYRDYPTHAAIFDDEEARNRYFQENFVPSWPEGTEVYWDDEMNQILGEQKLVWQWAYESYLAIKRGNERRLQTAVQSLSGDLIALICDKVLVPNIVPTKLNPIELGLTYGARKEVWGALYDYANTISELGDTLTEMVIGERASGDSGAEVMGKLTDMINMDLHMINLCMTRLRDNKSQLESLGPQKAAERKRVEQERSERIEAAGQANTAALAASPMNGLPMDEEILGNSNGYQSQIQELQNRRQAESNPTTQAQLDQQIQSKQSEYEAYRSSVIANIESRLASWASALTDALADHGKTAPSKVYPSPSSGWDTLSYLSSGSWYETGFRISEATASSDVSAYVQWQTNLKAAYPSWIEAGNALVIEYRNRYQEILTDMKAIGYVDNAHDDLLSKLSTLDNSASQVASYESDIEIEQAHLAAYLRERAGYVEANARSAARREELIANLQLAQVAYEQAHEAMTNLLAQLPAYLNGCTTDETLILRVPQSSQLWQDIYGAGSTGNAALLRRYCQEINGLYADYRVYELRKDLARKHVQAYWAEWRDSKFGESGFETVSLMMSPEDYVRLNLLKAAVRDFNLQYRDGRLLEYYAILADNLAYYAGQRSTGGSVRKGPVALSASIVADGELPSYSELCRNINGVLNTPMGFADGVQGYSPQAAGGVYETLIVPLQASIEGRRDALTWDYVIEGGKARILGIGGVASGAVTIPEAFEGCPVTELGDYLFTGSYGMTSVTIPESVTKIGACAFSGCTRLAQIRIPAQVASIGDSAFVGCDSLMRFEVAAGNAAYRAVNGLLFAKNGTDPIAGIAGEVEVPSGVKRIGKDVFYRRALTSVVLPPGVVEIGEQAFAYSSVAEITIPASVTTIASGAFQGCEQLSTVYVDQGDEFRVRELLQSAGVRTGSINVVGEFTETVDGVEWHYATANGEVVVTSIPELPEGESYGKVSVPATLGGMPVTAIGNSVFMWRSDIVEVEIQHGVRSIGDYAFNSSPSLKVVSIPESVTRLGELAFGYSSLTTVRTVKGDASRVKSLLKSAGLNISVKYDESLPKGVDPVKPTPVPGPDAPEAVEVTEPYAAPKAVKLYGCVYDGGELVDFIELKLGKVNAKKGTSKISASVTDVNGKRFSAKAVTVDGIDGTAPATVVLNVSKLGTLTLKIGGAKFAGDLNGLTAQVAAVGDTPVGTAEFGFNGGAPETIKGVAIEQGLLPEGEPITMDGKRWNFAKAASVAYKKDRATGEYDWVINGGKSNPQKSNLSGLKLSYSPKKAYFKGTFKAYGLDRKGKNPKLKKFTVKVSGFFVGGKGNGIATVKNEGTWKVEIR